MIKFGKPVFSRSKLIAFGVPIGSIIIIYLIINILALNSGITEQFYSSGIYPYIARIFSAFSNLFSFSLWDIFWMVAVFSLMIGLIFVFLGKLKPWKYGLRVLQMTAILYTFFYFIWGFNYFRPKFETRMGWEHPKTDEKEFRSVLDSIIFHTNLTQMTISPNDYPEIDKLVEASYRNNSAGLGINYPNGTRRPKTMIFSSFFAKSGVSGYFGPFFNEIHLNYYLLPMEYPFVLAHEKAHQFGITNEAEANLCAFIVCTTANDPRLQYSGYISLLLYFISDAVQLKDTSDYIRKIDKKVILDLRFQRSHWQGLRNVTLDKAQTAANNAYLKTNHIEAGVKNYNQVVSLVMGWYQNKDEILNRILD